MLNPSPTEFDQSGFQVASLHAGSFKKGMESTEVINNSKTISKYCSVCFRCSDWGLLLLAATNAVGAYFMHRALR